MDAYIEGARRFLPDAETRLDGGVDRCHEYLRFPVTISDGSGEPLRRGWQFAELGAEGRLRRIVAYWDQS